MKVKGIQHIAIDNSTKFPFQIVDKLPRDLTCILGQDWLRENQYIVTKGIAIPPYSEKVCTFPTQERAIRYVEQQKIKDCVFCASSLIECNKKFTCLLVNVTQDTQIPKLQKPLCKCFGMTMTDNRSREGVQLLLESLRLEHIREERQEIIALCKQYSDVFKLRGGK